jgi:hypothetical protein
MNFLHTDFWGGADSRVIVSLDAQCNVLLLSDTDFTAYRTGQSCRYYGGWATHSPVHLVPPGYGHWHVVVDLGGGSGRVRASVRIIKQSAVAQASVEVTHEEHTSI